METVQIVLLSIAVVCIVVQIFLIKHRRKVVKQLTVQVHAETNVDEVIGKIKELNEHLEKANSLIGEIASTDLEIKASFEKDWYNEIAVQGGGKDV